MWFVSEYASLVSKSKVVISSKVIVRAELARSANQPAPYLPLEINVAIFTLPRISDRRRRRRKGKCSRKCARVSLWVTGSRSDSVEEFEMKSKRAPHFLFTLDVSIEAERSEENSSEFQ